jgi:hypothetical protein
MRRAKLSETLIVKWAKAHRKQFGRWPSNRSGPVMGVPGITWANVAVAFSMGFRGLPGGEILAGLLR